MFGVGLFGVGLFGVGLFGVGLFGVGLFGVGLFGVGLFGIGLFGVGLFGFSVLGGMLGITGVGSGLRGLSEPPPPPSVLVVGFFLFSSVTCATVSSVISNSILSLLSSYPLGDCISFIVYVPIGITILFFFVSSSCII